MRENGKIKNVKDNYTPDNKAIRAQIKELIDDVQDILLETWCTQGLNLFELVIENTLEGKFRGDVFKTWLPWIFEFAKEHGFKQMWQSRLNIHYLAGCRKILDSAIHSTSKQEFIKEIKENYKQFKKMNLDEWINQ